LDLVKVPCGVEIENCIEGMNITTRIGCQLYTLFLDQYQASTSTNGWPEDIDEMFRVTLRPQYPESFVNWRDTRNPFS
jgi:hypothetical protein